MKMQVLMLYNLLLKKLLMSEHSYYYLYMKHIFLNVSYYHRPNQEYKLDNLPNREEKIYP